MGENRDSFSRLEETWVPKLAHLPALRMSTGELTPNQTGADLELAWNSFFS